MSNSKRIAILGKGHVGSALAQGLEKAGHHVMTAGRDPKDMAAVVDEGELVFLAVPYLALDEVVSAVGEKLKGKIVVDVTNALSKDRELALGFTTSGAEELQKKLRRSKVVKAFNTVFAQNMSTGRAQGQQLTVFVAADDVKAKLEVSELAAGIGFDTVDAGPLRNARLLEPLAYLNIQLGYTAGYGTEAGFQYLHGVATPKDQAP